MALNFFVKHVVSPAFAGAKALYTLLRAAAVVPSRHVRLYLPLKGEGEVVELGVITPRALGFSHRTRINKILVRALERHGLMPCRKAATLAAILAFPEWKLKEAVIAVSMTANALAVADGEVDLIHLDSGSEPPPDSRECAYAHFVIPASEDAVGPDEPVVLERPC